MKFSLQSKEYEKLSLDNDSDDYATRVAAKQEPAVAGETPCLLWRLRARTPLWVAILKKIDNLFKRVKPPKARSKSSRGNEGKIYDYATVEGNEDENNWVLFSPKFSP